MKKVLETPPHKIAYLAIFYGGLQSGSQIFQTDCGWALLNALLEGMQVYKAAMDEPLLYMNISADLLTVLFLTISL